MQEVNASRELGFFSAIVGSYIVYQSVDMFDFLAHHLSGYDYSTNRDKKWGSEMLQLLQEMMEGYRKKGYNNPSRVRNGNVLAIMPFHSGASKGKSGDSLSKAHMYLQATILAVAAVFPNIAVFVASTEDYNWLVYESGLTGFFMMFNWYLG
jgi:hypothetical protein